MHWRQGEGPMRFERLVSGSLSLLLGAWSCDWGVQETLQAKVCLAHPIAHCLLVSSHSLQWAYPKSWNEREVPLNNRISTIKNNQETQTDLQILALSFIDPTYVK